MANKSNRIKVKAGLKMVTSVMYNFYIRIEGLSLEELRKDKDNYSYLIGRKNNKGMSVKVNIELLEKIHGKLCPLKQPIKLGQLIIRADDNKNFSIYFNTRVARKEMKREGNSFKLELKHSIRDYFEIDIKYHFTKQMLNKIKKDYNKQTKINNRTYTSNKEDIQKKINEMVKKEKGITLSLKSSFKNCSNCYYNNEGKCGMFGVKVNKEEVCKHFYAPKVRIYSGGGFSPK